ncbi:NADH dehydrogenase [ubiquinone] 1 beta subcomplex subunit 9 [Grifola frondosa]|uniref:NADH dehydrogenase [ubiquinone] 1 beta subcomplex subunit 9 n=1 Tax=Grifola frondosa TaxID=5627 RepID=A0A1C7LZG8_GRIFR|nr:NADH dehydrogenase [ubiquinone] 1 beta subcomplex subunit 9 [Grifola frondosa]
MSTPVPFSTAHRRYVQSLYRRFLTNDLNWVINRDIWRGRALAIRAEFERNRNVRDPRALSSLLQKAEAYLAERQHPDPYRPAMAPDGTKWERNAPPPLGPIFDHQAYNEAHGREEH